VPCEVLPEPEDDWLGTPDHYYPETDDDYYPKNYDEHFPQIPREYYTETPFEGPEPDYISPKGLKEYLAKTPFTLGRFLSLLGTCLFASFYFFKLYSSRASKQPFTIGGFLCFE